MTYLPYLQPTCRERRRAILSQRALSARPIVTQANSNPNPRTSQALHGPQLAQDPGMTRQRALSVGFRTSKETTPSLQLTVRTRLSSLQCIQVSIRGLNTRRRGEDYGLEPTIAHPNGSNPGYGQTCIAVTSNTGMLSVLQRHLHAKDLV